MNFGTKTINRIISKLNMKGKKIKPVKAKFVSENALFFKALSKNKKQYPKINRTVESKQ